MIELLMILSMSSLSTPAVDFQPCVWPNPCGIVEEVEEKTLKVATKYEICKWPNKCSGSKAAVETVEEDAVLLAGTFEICVYPNPCSFAPGKETEIELI